LGLRERERMERSDYLARALETIEVGPKSISDLLQAMGRTGFQGKSLAHSLDVLVNMLQEQNSTIFLGYAGSMSTTGQWKIIKWLVENRYVDVLVSTGANISEDIFEAMGFNYYQGSHLADDADLLDKQIDRYYDVYADELQYRQMERLIYEFISGLHPSGPYSSAEFLHLFGRFLNDREIDSITAAAYRAGVPIFSPGMADSAYGVAAYLLNREKGIRVAVDQFKDFFQLGDIGDRAGSTSVIYIGGGVPKDTIQLVTVMVDLARGGEETVPHKYAVQITTDSPQWGGLSGCTFEEAISWGKIDPNGNRAVCYCDATIALPILSHGLQERGPFKREAPDLSWVFDDVAAGTVAHVG
jgi:deoxyhypusine synthase